MSFFIKKIGIDLGTTNTLVFLPGKGVVINEPSVVAVSMPENRILAVGNDAKEMVGRTPDSIIAYRPLKDGVIADYKVTEAMIRYFINKVGGRIRIFKPEVMVSVPAGITSTEKRAVIDATINAGAKAAYVVREPVLAAIGAGIPINSPSGHMIIGIGGGTTEVAVISLGGIVSWASVRVGGNKIDSAIAEYIKKKYNLAVGDRTAEEIKISIGSAIPLSKDKEMAMEVRGRDLIAGMPKAVKIRSNEITEAIVDQLREIVHSIKIVLRETPPELSADIMDKGIILSGGSALLRNIDKLIGEAIGVPCYIADEPLLCVAKGTGVVLDNLEIYKRSIMSKK